MVLDSEFNIVAEFDVSRCGTIVLTLKGFNYGKRFYCPKKGTTTWCCTSNKSEKCPARVLTKELNGITMMKLTNINHTHGIKDYDKGC